MRISDWSSDVCSSDLAVAGRAGAEGVVEREQAWLDLVDGEAGDRAGELGREGGALAGLGAGLGAALGVPRLRFLGEGEAVGEVERRLEAVGRSEEHTSELQSLMRISYAVFCLKKKNKSHRLTYYH